MIAVHSTARIPPVEGLFENHAVVDLYVERDEFSGARRVGTMRIGAEASAVVGNTPLILLDRLGAEVGGDVCAKLEYFNPGGSVKDRIGVAMIDAAEEAGQIKPGRPVGVGAARGNTGIALAMGCGAGGLRLNRTP